MLFRCSALLGVFLLFACTSPGGAQNGAPPPPEKPSPPKKTPKVNTKAVRTSNGVDRPKLKKFSGKYDACQDGSHKLEIPIVVNDGGNDWVYRDPEITGFLVPFSKKENLRSLNKLAVFDAQGKRLPAQFEVISRWSGHPGDCSSAIRYAFAHVNAAPVPTSKVQWTVKHLDNNPGEMSALSLATTGDAWVIDTGVARFTVDKKSVRGIGKVELYKKGRPFVVAEAGRFIIEQKDGIFDASLGAAWKLELERKGPQVVTVLARGYYPSKRGNKPGKAAKDRGLAFTVRLHYYAGASTVKVEHTYYYGELAGWNADQATKLAVIKRAYMSVPLTAAAKSVYARMETNVLGLPGTKNARIEQEKRTPKQPAVIYGIRSGGKIVESGGYGWLPFLAAVTPEYYALATVARMAVREPQGITWSAKKRSLEVDFTSSPIQIASARGIWSVASVDFGLSKPDGNRAYAAQLHAERPLLGAPAVNYVNTTQTIGPYPPTEKGPGDRYFDQVESLHEKTVEYLQEYRITGIQIWPDLPKGSCYIDGNCPAHKEAYFAGGENNYWNWSKPGIDEFFRTGNNNALYDFSLGENVLMVETLAFRTYHDRISDSSVAGLAPCYGTGYGWSQNWIEGTNNRRDLCPGDRTYNKSLSFAYLATGDRRFADYFGEAGVGVTNTFGKPEVRTQPDLELSLKRLTEQRMETLLNGVEFERDPKRSAFLRGKLKEYVDFMLGRVLINGHSCDTSSRAVNDVRLLKRCWSQQAWMHPMSIAWAIRTAKLLDHKGLRDWIMDFATTNAKNHTVLDSDGLPDFSKTRGSSSDNNGNGWRTIYGCDVDKNGLKEASCKKAVKGENDLYFYSNGLVAYLNIYGHILAFEPSDPKRICKWLPKAFDRSLAGLNDFSLNGGVWGKSPGQAFAMAAETLGAISRCQ